MLTNYFVEGQYILEGEVKLREGPGKYRNQYESYDGDWKHDLMDGQGIYKFASGAQYNVFILFYSC